MSEDESPQTIVKTETKTLHAYHLNLPPPHQKHQEWLLSHHESLIEELKNLVEVELLDITEPFISKKISRLAILVTHFETLKFPLPLALRCSILQRSFELVCITTNDVIIDGTKKTYKLSRKPVFLRLRSTLQDAHDDDDYENDAPLLQSEYKHIQFQLLPPSRLKLLDIISSLLQHKLPLEHLSNFTPTPPSPTSSVSKFRIHWKTLLLLLLQQVLLDHRITTLPPSTSHHSHSNLCRNIALVIRSSRRFFYNENDVCSNQLIQLTSHDFHLTETYLAFRSATLLTLFLPTSSSPSFYSRHVPLWIQTWSKISRNTDWDSCFVVLFCRARHYLLDEEHDHLWQTISQIVISRASYWIQIPIKNEQDFVASPIKPQGFPSVLSRLKKGVMLQKVGMLMVHCLGRGEKVDGISKTTSNFLRFWTFVGPYLHPSNAGKWIYGLAGFLASISMALADRIGESYGPAIDQKPIPKHEIALILDTLFPLTFQTLYSKSPHIETFGLNCFQCLMHIAPRSILPYSLEFGIKALDITSINSAHQAPAALKLLKCLVQPGLRNNGMFRRYLSEILMTSLPGLDGNDEKKTMRTLNFYGTLASFFPMGPQPPKTKRARMISPDGTIHYNCSIEDMTLSKDYQSVLSTLPPTSPLFFSSNHNHDDEMDANLIEEETILLFSDWILLFLEKIYSLLQTQGPKDKSVSRSSSIGALMSSINEHHSRKFSFSLFQCLLQVFGSLGSDTSYESAARHVQEFLKRDGSFLPHAAKDVSSLCCAVVSSNPKQGMELLFPILSQNVTSKSDAILAYRLRCLAGCVRFAQREVLKYEREICELLESSLLHEHKKVRKGGCKLLRHVLASQVECYPVDWYPRFDGNIGTSAELGGGAGEEVWHVPSGEQIDFAVKLLRNFPLKYMKELEEEEGDASGAVHSQKILNRTSSGQIRLNTEKWRSVLKVLHYSLRGAIGILLDDHEDSNSGDMDWTLCSDNDEVDSNHEQNNSSLHPQEKATRSLISSASSESQSLLRGLRNKLCFFLAKCMKYVSNPNNDETSSSSSSSSALFSDVKIAEEIIDMSKILPLRRGAFTTHLRDYHHFIQDEKFNIRNDVLKSQYYAISSHRQRSDPLPEGMEQLYKDGEKGGKTHSWRVIMIRLWTHHLQIQCQASYDIPRRLRGQEGGGLLVGYEKIINGLFTLSCHSNIRIRASAQSPLEQIFKYYGWLIRERIPRLLSAIDLSDEHRDGLYGIPSCAKLTNQPKRLSEVIRGVCSILLLKRCLKEILGSISLRTKFVKTMCQVQKVLSYLPSEESPKVTAAFDALFLNFRSNWYELPCVAEEEERCYRSCALFLIENLVSSSMAASKDDALPSNEMKDDIVSKPTTTDETNIVLHWKYKLHTCWFLLHFAINTNECNDDSSSSLIHKILPIAFDLIETENGQPIQRVALGLLTRITDFTRHKNDLIRDKLLSQTFCKTLGHALSVNHKGSRSSDGHQAQWSKGIEEILQDSSLNSVGKRMYPISRGSHSSGRLKIQHLLLLENVLIPMDREEANMSIGHLLKVSKNLANAPPSEDQNNEQKTAAEIFGGVCEVLLIHSREGVENRKEVWSQFILPFLDEVLTSITIDQVSNWTDAIRCAFNELSADDIFPLFEWILCRLDDTLSLVDSTTSTTASNNNGDTKTGGSITGFSSQSKWLGLTSTLLGIIEKNVYLDGPLFSPPPASQTELDGLRQTWSAIRNQLLPRLFQSIGHPYEACRNRIAFCLFRICLFHRKLTTSSENAFPDNWLEKNIGEGPPIVIREFQTRLLLKQDCDNSTKTVAHYAHLTFGLFLNHCVQEGDDIHDYSNLIIPLLPLAFESLDVSNYSSKDNTTTTASATTHASALDTDVTKLFRRVLASISQNCLVGYGNYNDMTTVLQTLETASQNDTWQIRMVSALFLKLFQSRHFFLFSQRQSEMGTQLVTNLLADERREVSSAAMATLTGILAVTPSKIVREKVTITIGIANRTAKKKKTKKSKKNINSDVDSSKEQQRMRDQQKSVFFLCAAVLSRPYDTPVFVPEALEALSKHSFEDRAPIGVRDVVKKCFSEYKRTHVDNWELHRSQFTREQLDAMADVVSTPHYYA